MRGEKMPKGMPPKPKGAHMMPDGEAMHGAMHPSAKGAAKGKAKAATAKKGGR